MAMSTQTENIINGAQAALVGLGGVMGYVKAGSVPSLMAGLLSGGALAYGAQRIASNPADTKVMFGVNVILAASMGYRFFRSGRFMPAGLGMSYSYCIWDSC